MRGQICVVTGATSGIGKEIALGLAALGAHVVIVARSQEKGEAVRQEIEMQTGNSELEIALVDLSSLASIRRFADNLLKKHPKIHLLINDAGVFETEYKTSQDGYEMTWAVNVLGYFLITELLLPAIKAAAPSRIVNVSSTYVLPPSLEDVDFTQRRFNGITAYRESKAAERLLTWAFARRLIGTNVTINALHPGGVSTPIYRELKGVCGFLWRLYIQLTKLTPKEGAKMPLWVATSPELEGISGKFFVDFKEKPCEFRNQDTEEALWALCKKKALL